MFIEFTEFPADQEIPEEYAFCAMDPTTHVRMAANHNPGLRWGDAPANTRSFALVCHDPDVPSKPDDVNQEGREVPAHLARVDFYHWLLADIPASLKDIKAGEFSEGTVPGGKQVANGPHGTRQGINNYTEWFANDPQMRGHYFGYDGPCPPWNDTLLHHYIFTLYALDLERLPLPNNFRAEDLLAAMNGHILDQASVTGTYSLNPKVAY